MEEKQETPTQQAPPAVVAPEEKEAEEKKTEGVQQAPQAAPSKPEEKEEKGNESEDEDAEKAKGSWWGSSWGSGWGSGWGSSWGKSLTTAFNTVKEVTANVAEICVQDLKDFRGQIQEDTTKALNRKFYELIHFVNVCRYRNRYDSGQEKCCWVLGTGVLCVHGRTRPRTGSVCLTAGDQSKSCRPG